MSENGFAKAAVLANLFANLGTLTSLQKIVLHDNGFKVADAVAVAPALAGLFEPDRGMITKSIVSKKRIGPD